MTFNDLSLDDLDLVQGGCGGQKWQSNGYGNAQEFTWGNVSTTSSCQGTFTSNFVEWTTNVNGNVTTSSDATDPTAGVFNEQGGGGDTDDPSGNLGFFFHR